MTDPIKALIAAARKAAEAWRKGTYNDERMAIVELVLAADAAEARPEPKPDPALRDWPEDFPHENGNYTNTCSTCEQRFIGHKTRCVCKVCAYPPARPEPAAEPSRYDFCMTKARNMRSFDWICDAVEALAREVRR